MYKYKVTDEVCLKCKGKYWDASDQLKTQQAVRNAFGLVSSYCCPEETGRVLCPYAHDDIASNNILKSIKL